MGTELKGEIKGIVGLSHGNYLDAQVVVGLMSQFDFQNSYDRGEI